MTTTHRATLRTVSQFVANREDFDCNGSLTGRSHVSSLPWGHRLPELLEREINRVKDADDFYAVFSYDTPIAWFANGRWNMPTRKYSPTTSRHQSAIGVRTMSNLCTWSNY